MFACLLAGLLGAVDPSVMAGRAAFARQHYEAAATAFSQSLERQPSVEAWEGLSEVRVAQRRFVEGLQAAEQAVRLAPATDRKLKARLAARVAELVKRVGRVALRTPEALPEGSTAHVGAESIRLGSMATSVLVEPGHVIVSWQAPGYVPERVEVDVPAGESVVVLLHPLRAEAPVAEAVPQVEPTPAPAATPPVVPTVAPSRAVGARPLGPLVLGGAGLLVSIAGGVGLGLSLSSWGRFNVASANGPDTLTPPFTRDEEVWVKSPGFQALFAGSVAAVGVGLAAAAAGLVWGLRAPVVPLAWVGPGQHGVGLSVTW